MAGYLVLVAAVTLGVWSYAYRQAMSQVAARGTSDLALASDRLVAQLSRYREAAVLLADHPDLTSLRNGGDPDRARSRLLRSMDRTAALTAVYAAPDGRILAAAQDPVPDDLSQAPYFRRALQGALGSGHGRSTGFGRRAYFYAAPSFGDDGMVSGVLIFAVDIDKLEQEWRGARPTVYFTDDAGLVFVSNRSELLGWTMRPGGMESGEGKLRQIRVTRAAGFEVWRHDLSNYIPDNALHLVQPLPVIGMTGEALVDIAPALRLAGLQAAVVAALFLSFGTLLFVGTARRRALAEANLVLEDRVAARTRALESSNRALRREVSERQDAEAALKRAQDDLVQAGKLSALGQMSAGLSHELNQPLMAIRSFAENAVAFLERGKADRAADNLSRISDMAHRMGRIISNLRAFARQENAPVGRVDLRAVLDSAVELTSARMAQAGVELIYDRPAAPVLVRAGEVRLGQVFVNLISNAVDAMAAGDVRRLTISVDDAATLAVHVADTGPGLDAPDKIFEPFYSTKTVGAGEGMGLGLSISYGLVQSFGGSIRGANAPEGGAVFTVELERWTQEAAA